MHARLSIIVLVLGLMSFSAPSLAALPEVLDRVPVEGPSAVIALPSLERFDDNSSELLLSIEANAISSFGQTLSVLGLRDGLEMSGSAAGLVYAGAQGEGEAAPPRLLLLLPTSDQDALKRSVGASAIDGTTVEEFEIAGTIYALRALDLGFILVGDDRGLVESFEPAQDARGAHAARLGARGERLASSSDLFAITSAGEARPLLAGLLGPLLQAAPGLPVPGAIGEDDPRAGAVRQLLERVEEDGNGAMLGLTTGPLGVRVDLVTSLDPESELGALANHAPEARRGLEALPAQRPIFAGSMNLTHAGWRALLDRSAREAAGAEVAPDANTAALARSLAASLDGLESASVAIYPPANPFSGLLARTCIVWQGNQKSAGGVANALRLWISGLDATDQFASSYNVGASEVAGASVDAWSITPATAAPTMGMLFGGASLSGLLFHGEESGGMLWSNDQELARAVIDVDEPLSQAQMLAQVSQLLPEDRVVEWYVDFGPALELYGPMLAMLTGGAPLDVPDLLPPIGASASLSEHSVHGSMFIPSPLIKLSIDTMQRVAAAQGLQGQPQAPPQP